VASFKTYVSESYNELVHKVSWPTWKELQSSAILVLVSAVDLLLDRVPHGPALRGAQHGASNSLERAPGLHLQIPRDSDHGVTTATKKWYVLRAISGKEKKVKELIDAEMRRSNMGAAHRQVLIPMEKFYQIRDGKKVSKERNFFPGYVLLEADLTGEIAHTLKQMTNVIGFLGAEKGRGPRSLAP
jgi:hypothetical protein